jgi:hypothetical protein
MVPDVFSYSSNTYDTYEPYYSEKKQMQLASQQAHLQPPMTSEFNQENQWRASGVADLPYQSTYNHPNEPISHSTIEDPNGAFVGYSANNYRAKPYPQKMNAYKYNIYSIIDEPWNRFWEAGKCGSCPDN